MHVSDWQPLTGTATDASAAVNGPQSFPRAIRIDRPRDDYRLDLQVTKIELNVDLAADRFQLSQPPDSELVRVDSNANSKQPATGSRP